MAGGRVASARSREGLAADREIRRLWVKQRREARSARVPRLLHAWAGVSLDISTHNLLVALADAGPMRMSELARRTGSDLSTVSRQVGLPEALGLVDRMPAVGEGKGQVLQLTSKGETLVRALMRGWDRLLAPVLVDWSDEDLVAFRGYLQRFIEGLEAQVQLHARPGLK